MGRQYKKCNILSVYFEIIHPRSADYGGESVAKQSPKQNKKNRRRARRQPLGAMPALIALIGVLALPLTYFAQSLADGGRAPSASASAGGLRISEIMTSNASTLIADDGTISWIRQ